MYNEGILRALKNKWDKVYSEELTFGGFLFICTLSVVITVTLILIPISIFCESDSHKSDVKPKSVMHMTNLEIREFYRPLCATSISVSYEDHNKTILECVKFYEKEVIGAKCQ